MRFALLLTIALALAACTTVVPQLEGHSHTGQAMRLDCEGCALAVQGSALRVHQALQRARPAPAAPARQAPASPRPDPHDDQPAEPPEESP